MNKKPYRNIFLDYEMNELNGLQTAQEIRRTDKNVQIVCHAYFYGSYARDDYDSESDIDILVTVDMDAEKLSGFTDKAVGR